MKALGGTHGTEGTGGDGGSREAMSRVDTAWLRMERPTNLMMISGVIMFDQPLDIARLRTLIAERFLAFRRFRQKAVDTQAGASWEDDEDFELDWHVRLTALPGKAGKKELQRLASLLASTPLDHSKPLWQFHLVERYDGGSALIARIHHCYADGVALIQVLLSLTDATPEGRPGTELPKAWLKRDGENVTARFLDPARAGLDKAIKLGGMALDKGMELYQNPSLAAVLAREGSEIARELACAVSLSDDPQTRLKGPLGVTKRAAWADPLPLEEVKTVGRALGCTVNDVLLASAAGALRSYLLDCGDACEGTVIRATVPVNLRPLEHAKKLGNHFGLVFLDLPVGEANPLRRLERIAASMQQLKGSRQAAVTFGLLAALGMAPAPLQRVALELFSRKASAVATNVPGPQMPLYMAGSPIREMMFWVPQTGSVGLGISILSYNGNVHFGLIADAKRMPDPAAVIGRFRVEFEKLLYATLMEDWQAPITAAGAEATLLRYAVSASSSASSARASPARARRRSSRSR
jgi:WS/DGAT/MGAT family acyltransferase